MATTLRDKMASLSEKHRARIDAETDRLHEEYKTLQELRMARELWRCRRPSMSRSVDH